MKPPKHLSAELASSPRDASIMPEPVLDPHTRSPLVIASYPIYPTPHILPLHLHAPLTPLCTNPKRYEVASPLHTDKVPAWPLAGHLTQGGPGAHIHCAADEIQVCAIKRSPRKPYSVVYTVFQGLEFSIFNNSYFYTLPHFDISDT